MFQHSKALLGRQARELGFVRDQYEKACRLIEVLKFFEHDETLGRCLALKGGTAINLTIFNLPRLSVDIDLDFSENVMRDKMLSMRTAITDRIARYMRANGYSLSSKSKQHHALDSFVYNYINSVGNKDNIKIEINYVLRCHVLEVGQRQFDSVWDSKKISVCSVAPVEIFGSKVVALLNRVTPRDLYDIHNLVKSNLIVGPEKQLLKKCVVFYSAIAADRPPSEFKLDNVDLITEKQVKASLRPVLSRKDKFDLSSAQKQVKAWLTDLLQLENNEWEFLNAFRDKEYQPHLLFSSAEILERIQDHPMAIWKCSTKIAE